MLVFYFWYDILLEVLNYARIFLSYEVFVLSVLKLRKNVPLCEVLILSSFGLRKSGFISRRLKFMQEVTPLSRRVVVFWMCFEEICVLSRGM